MSPTNPQRRDDVDRYYDPTKILTKIKEIIFWSYVALSLVLLFFDTLLSKSVFSSLQILFLILVISYFVISQVLNLSLFPKAASMRRKYLFSDSFATLLSTDETSSYFNNDLPPSIRRLGANTMENAFFSQEIASIMLKKKIPITVLYIIIWFTIALARQSSLELITLASQVVFSGEIITKLFKLNLLKTSCDRVYHNLSQYFILKPEPEQNYTNSVILAAVADYEIAKSYASVALSTKEFNKINPQLSKKWNAIAQKLDLKIRNE